MDNIDLKLLLVFDEIYKTHSISQAAEEGFDEARQSLDPAQRTEGQPLHRLCPAPGASRPDASRAPRPVRRGSIAASTPTHLVSAHLRRTTRDRLGE